MTAPILDERHWLNRGEEAAAMAEATHDPAVRNLLLDLATEYFWNVDKMSLQVACENANPARLPAPSSGSQPLAAR
jgi:hypothetical protein